MIRSGQESTRHKKGVANHIRTFQGKESGESGKLADGETEKKERGKE